MSAELLEVAQSSERFRGGKLWLVCGHGPSQGQAASGLVERQAGSAVSLQRLLQMSAGNSARRGTSAVSTFGGQAAQPHVVLSKRAVLPKAGRCGDNAQFAAETGCFVRTPCSQM